MTKLSRIRDSQSHAKRPKGSTQTDSEDQHGSVDRRGARPLTAVPARDHCLSPERVDAPIGEAGRYGRMFDLPALEVDEALLHHIGAVGGFSDAGDSPGDARAEAGQPFFAQYVAHDLTADRSPLRAHA